VRTPRFVGPLILLALAFLIALPVGLASYSKYSIPGAYFALGFCLPVLPALLLCRKGYWSSRLTQGLWALRILAVILFLVTSLRCGMSSGDMASLAGTLGLTVFYEVGFLIARTGNMRVFLQCWVTVGVGVGAVFVATLLPHFLIHRNASWVMSHMEDLRHVWPSWPNYFAMYMVLVLWATFAAVKQGGWRCCLLWIEVITLVLTLSRTAAVGLIVSGIPAILLFMRWKRKPLPLLGVALAVCMLCLVPYWKPTTPGGELAHTMASRVGRWDAAISLWEVNPLAGIGLRSFTGQSDMIEIDPGVVTQMGSSHSDFVDLLLRGGVVWSAAFWTFVLLGMTMSFLQGRREPMLGFLACGILSLLFAAAFQNPLKDAVLAPFLWVSLAAAACAHSSRRANRACSSRRLLGFTTHGSPPSDKTATPGSDATPGGHASWSAKSCRC
jgi:hypothetical protein